MGLRGPRGKPLEQERLDGFPGKGKRMANAEIEERLKASDEIAPVGDPFPDMDEMAKTKWHELARVWSMILKATDRENLRAYCETWCDMIHAQNMMHATGGQVILTKDGMSMKQNPWASRLDKSREAVRRMLMEFGATPAARQRVELSEPSKKAGSKFSGLVN